MIKLIVVVIISVFWCTTASASGIEYRMRVDGLACPYCAYGIEKKLKAIDGVQKIDVNLDDGLVIVDAGFTFRSMTEKPAEDDSGK